MEQRIRFLKVDGRRIAFATCGSGPALVFPTGWFSHLELEWSDPAHRTFIEALAAGHTVVRYDRLGAGLSDRERPDETLTLDYEVEILGALLEHLDLGPCTLVGLSYGGCIATALAAARPEHVRRLVLYGTYADGGAIAPPAVKQSLPAVIRAHWGLGSRVLAEVFVPDGDRDITKHYAAYQREAASAENAAAFLELVYETDVRERLAALRAPALVLHRRDDPAIPARLGRELAALLPDAELKELDGRWHQPWYGNVAAVLDAILSFTGGPRPPATDPVADDAVRLTAREAEVLALVADGLSDAEIAERLVISPHTVHRHVANIRGKLGRPSRAAAAAAAMRAGLI
jgi:pimeloyl-ACP methyl ester carboxylesterase/DNA-binding CsgD family transcriptional regulator